MRRFTLLAVLVASSAAGVIVAAACSSDSFTGAATDAAASDGGSSGDGQPLGDDGGPSVGDAAKDGGPDATHMCDRTTHDFCVDFDTGLLDKSVAATGGDGGSLVIDSVGRGSPFSAKASGDKHAWGFAFKNFSSVPKTMTLGFDLRLDDGGATSSVDVAAWRFHDASSSYYAVFLRVTSGALHLVANEALADGGSSSSAQQDRVVTSFPSDPTAWHHIELSLVSAFAATPQTSILTWTVRVDYTQPTNGSGTLTPSLVPAPAGPTTVAAGLVYANDTTNVVHVDNVTADVTP